MLIDAVHIFRGVVVSLFPFQFEPWTFHEMNAISNM